MLSDYLEGVAETVGAQNGLGHLQHRTQCPHIIDHRGVEEREARGILATGDHLLSLRWQLLFTCAVVWVALLKSTRRACMLRKL